MRNAACFISACAAAAASCCCCNSRAELGKDGTVGDVVVEPAEDNDDPNPDFASADCDRMLDTWDCNAAS